VASHKTARSICVEVVRILAEERKKQAITKYALSTRSGLSQQMIGYVEKGLRSPSFETIVRSAEGLDVDLGAVFQRARKRIQRK
jgi:transcriptional regulator with XRE-family HTH domain